MGLRQRISGSAFNKSLIFRTFKLLYLGQEMEGNVGPYRPLTVDELARHGAIIMLSNKRMGFSHSSQGTKMHKFALTALHNALSRAVML